MRRSFAKEITTEGKMSSPEIQENDPGRSRSRSREGDLRRAKLSSRVGREQGGKK